MRSGGTYHLPAKGMQVVTASTIAGRALQPHQQAGLSITGITQTSIRPPPLLARDEPLADPRRGDGG